MCAMILCNVFFLCFSHFSFFSHHFFVFGEKYEANAFFISSFSIYLCFLRNNSITCKENSIIIFKSNCKIAKKTNLTFAPFKEKNIPHYLGGEKRLLVRHYKPYISLQKKSQKITIVINPLKFLKTKNKAKQPISKI